jgi:hypothetical protein
VRLSVFGKYYLLTGPYRNQGNRPDMRLGNYTEKLLCGLVFEGEQRTAKAGWIQSFHPQRQTCGAAYRQWEVSAFQPRSEVSPKDGLNF